MAAASSSMAQTLLTVSGSSLQGNVAYGSGGAVYTPGALVLANTLVGGLTPNVAQTGSGGGIFAGQNTTLTTAIISGNLAGSNNTDGGGGGGVFTTGILNLITTSVVGNKTAGNGGGIDDASTDATVTLNNSHVDGNDAAFGLILTDTPIADGGTGYTEGEILTVQGGGGIVPARLEVTSEEDGVITGVSLVEGGIYAVAPAEPVSVDIGTATFNLTTSPNGNGGGIFAGSNVTLAGISSANGNDSLGSGGGIFSSHGNVALAGSSANGNVAQGSGGGVYAQDNILVTGTSQINGNSAGGNGGGLYAHFGNVSVGGTSAAKLGMVNGNSAGESGGGIWADDGISLTFAQADGNTASDQGGGLWSEFGGVTLANADVSINNSGGSGSGADNSGGGVWSEYGGVALSATTVDTNNANPDSTTGPAAASFPSSARSP